MKKIHKWLSVLFCVLLSVTCLLFTGCKDGEDQTPEARSALRGTFTYQNEIIVPFKKEISDGQHLYCSLYPHRDMGEANILYRMNQRLKLNRDYTYSYTYSVILGNPNPWGNLEQAKVAVSITGTFTYTAKPYSTGEYIVRLSNPTGGTEEIYGMNFSGANPADLYSWSIHGTADYKMDFSTVSQLDNFVYDEYVEARTVYVYKAQTEDESNILTDNIFYPYILDDIARYSTY